MSVFVTIESTIGKNIELIDALDVNSVAPALIVIIMINVNSFRLESMSFKLCPIKFDKPEFCFFIYLNFFTLDFYTLALILVNISNLKSFS